MGELRLWLDTVRTLFVAADGAAALRSVFVYISQVTDLPEDEVRNFLTVEIGPESENLLKTTYDRLVDKGRAEGGAAILLRLLTERFGALPTDVSERVRTASVEQLDRWAGAFLGAKTLEDVFATG